MGFKFNPFTGNLDVVDTTAAAAAGSNTEVQFNSSGAFAGSADLTWDDTGKVLGVGGDIDLDDGGTYTTTLQTITPTAARTISFPDSTGTVALVAGSSGQLLYNNAGANAGVPSSIVSSTGNITLSLNGALSATGIAGVPVAATGTWIATGGTATTTKPQVLIEPTGATSTAWSTSGTGFGVNAASGFAGNLLDLQVNGTSQLKVSSDGVITKRSSNVANATDNYWIKDSSNFAIGQYAGSLITFSTSANGSGVGAIGISLNDVRMSSAHFLTWTSAGAWQTAPELYLGRDAADTLAQRRSTNAQTFRCYGTYTDASNYVRAALSSTSTAVTLAAETAGTGADDIPLNLTAAGTGTIQVNSVAEVVVSSTVAGLPAAPVVGMLTRVTDATAPAVGSTVAGGGAAAALCWYNGANWSVIGV
jgi:hypothetical protein